ncbi:subtilisin-like protein, partial [Bimuria novae-zelandiae CBS 107.79]
IKVAMLDSGIDPDHPYIKKMWTQERDGGSYRDFVGVDPTPCDRDGHGTHCAGIILQHAPEVSLYIGRVVDTQKSCLKDRSLHHKAKALEWALQEVKADIVSMSFGLPWEAPGISNLILKNLVSTTFVAAAANSGSSEPVAFPASESTVLCMHACGGNGKPSLFTPPVQSYNNNFMVLGERVPSCWP